MLEQRYSDNESSRRDIPSFIEPLPPLIQNPFMRPRPQRGINLLEQFDEDSESEEPELVQVYLRMKPCNVQNNLYEVRSDKCLVTSLDTTTAGHGRRTQHNVSRMYTFSKIFGADCSQKEIFDQVVKENLKKLPEGHSFTLLTYGASGSGKTYTLMGTVTSPGLVPRALEYVFKVVDAAQMPVYKPSDTGADQLSYGAQDQELQWVKRLRQVSAPLRDKYRRMSVQLHNDMTTSNIDLANRTKYYVWVSFVEIYNEAIYDLLAPPDQRTKMRIREDSSGNVYVKGVRQAFVRSGSEAYDVMAAGRHNLTVAATGVHAHSSRSHCIFTITMLTEQDGELRTSHIRLCDLAGCERQRAARNTGARLQESRAINTSLHVLERCLHMLRRKQRVKETSLVPYRESKLTRLLGSGLSGSRGEAVGMVVTLNPAPACAHETKHVLSLASVAQDIQINNTMFASTLETINDTQDTTITSSAEVVKLRSDNERLHFELVQAQARNKELLASMEESQVQNANQIQEYVAEAKAFTTQFYQAEIEALKTEMEELKEEYENLLAKQSAPNEPESPSKNLHAKVTELMTEIAVLQEQLVEEKLARARAEKEVQHLRTCIEERDEKAFTESSEKEEVVLTDSDNESDDEIFNESLEPVFRKEQNKSLMSKNVSKTNQNETLDNTLNDKSNDTLKDDSVKINEQIVEDLGESKHEQESLDDFSLARDGNTDSSYNITNNSEYTTKDRSACEDVFYEATKLQDINDDQNKQAKLSRETYFVKEEPKVKSLSRGTYFVDAPTYKDVQDKTFERPEISETFVNKIIKSLKTSDGSNSSLSQFEQLEMAANNYSVIQREKSQNFDDRKILKKRNYFYDNNETIHEFGEKSDNLIKKDEMTADLLAYTKKQDNPVGSDNPKVTLTSPAMQQEHKLYFDEPKVTSDEVLISRSGNTEKRTYFDNIGPKEPTDKKLDNKDPIVACNKILKIDFKYDERSPSIVKEDIPKDYQPSTIKKLIGESYNENTVRKVLKKPNSIDLFESPNLVNIINKEFVNKTKDTAENHPKAPTIVKDVHIEQIRKSIEGLEIKQTKLDFLEPVIEKSDAKIIANASQSVKSEINVTVNAESLNNTQKDNNTIDEFENICKDLSNVRATEFDLLVTQIDSPHRKEEKQDETRQNLQNDDTSREDLQNNDKPKNDIKIGEKSMNDIKMEDKLKNDLPNDEKSSKYLQPDDKPRDDHHINDKSTNDHQSIDESKNNEQNEETKAYNLRKKVNIKNYEYDEIIAQSQSKCEKTLTKRSLRLRRRKNFEDGDFDKDDKLKDIVNLKQEFSDVTMGLPAAKKEVKDIPSPEKLPGEEENFPPNHMMGIQSCPSKSVQRSRRKLFTPRAEPLEEGLQEGESNERLRVPRPSYHRTRARRKL